MISLPALVSLILNLILWINVRKYVRLTQQWSGNLSLKKVKKERPKSDIDEEESAENMGRKLTRLSSNTTARSTSTTSRHSRRLRPRDTYHLVIIAANIIDLPFYCFYLLKKYSDIKTPVFETVSISFYIIGHSINIIVCLLFHKEFRLTAIKLFRKV